MSFVRDEALKVEVRAGQPTEMSDPDYCERRMTVLDLHNAK